MFDFLWFEKILFPWSNACPMFFQLFSHDFLMISHDFPMIFPWFSHYFPMIFPLFSHDILMIFSWFSHYFPMIFSWFSHYFPMIFPWFFHDILMIFSLFSHDFLIIFHILSVLSVGDFHWFPLRLPSHPSRIHCGSARSLVRSNAPIAPWRCPWRWWLATMGNRSWEIVVNNGG
jgi:hypothetical protein